MLKMKEQGAPGNGKYIILHFIYATFPFELTQNLQTVCTPEWKLQTVMEMDDFHIQIRNNKKDSISLYLKASFNDIWIVMGAQSNRKCHSIYFVTTRTPLRAQTPFVIKKEI